MEHKTANAKVLLLPNNLTNSKQQHFGNFSVIRASDVASTTTQIGKTGGSWYAQEMPGLHNFHHY